jgi:hypothetical protein
MKWISVDDRMPEDETPVLIVRNGEIRIGEIRWEHPSFEDTYEAFRYWDDPYDDGQSWENFEITHWMPLPELPEISVGASDKPAGFLGSLA